MLLLLVFLPAIVAGAAYLAIAIRLGQPRRPTMGVCARCGYDLTSLDPGMPCPECGSDPRRPPTESTASSREAMTFVAVLVLFPAPLVLPPIIRGGARLLDEATGFNLYRALLGSGVIEVGWLLGYGALVLAHCLAIEICLRRMLPRRGSTAIVACALPVWLVSAVLCGFATTMILFRFLPD